MSVDINTAARRVRAAFKKLDYDPKDRVSVKNTDYTSTIIVDLPSDEDDEKIIRREMNKIEDECGGWSDFDWIT